MGFRPRTTLVCLWLLATICAASVLPAVDRPPAIRRHASANEESSSLTRAAWVPTQSFGSFSASDVQFLASIGVKRLFVDVWNNGVVYFNSSTMRAIAPDAVSPVDHFTMIRGWGLMYGVEIVAWFEYGLMACYGEPGFRPFPSYAESQGWLVSGSAEGGFRYMDPSNAGVQAFLANMMAEVGAAGAQLDDHFSCPTAYSGCSEAKMTAAARAIAQQVGGRTQLHLAPAPLSFSIDHLNANWLPWLQQGLFSTVAPQLYTANPTQYETELSESLAAVGAGFKSKYLAGVRVLGAGSDTPWTDVNQMLSIAQRSGVGVSIWDVAGITELYKTQFQQLWG